MSSRGVLHESKISTTPDDPSRAVVIGLEALLRELALAPHLIAEVLHGTTVGSNTILQRTGARTGLITTRGFRDVLEIGRIRMPDMFDLTLGQAKAAGAAPLSPGGRRTHCGRRQYRRAAQRKRASSTAGEQLAAAGIEAVAVCLHQQLSQSRCTSAHRRHSARALSAICW